MQLSLNLIEAALAKSDLFLDSLCTLLYEFKHDVGVLRGMDKLWNGLLKVLKSEYPSESCMKLVILICENDKDRWNVALESLSADTSTLPALAFLLESSAQHHPLWEKVKVSQSLKKLIEAYLNCDPKDYLEQTQLKLQARGKVLSVLRGFLNKEWAENRLRSHLDSFVEFGPVDAIALRLDMQVGGALLEDVEGAGDTLLALLFCCTT